jgi:hypothetical protein
VQEGSFGKKSPTLIHPPSKCGRCVQHFEPVVLINHDIHPFDGECNVIPSPFVNYNHHVMIS